MPDKMGLVTCSCYFIALCLAAALLGNTVGAECEEGLQDVYLLSLENKSSGVGVSVFADNRTPSRQISTTKSFTGRYLPSECGVHYHRCQELLVVTSNLSASTIQHIVFVPFMDGILILDLQSDMDRQLLLVDDHIIDIPVECSPVAVIRILGTRTFAICISLERHYLTVLEIYLDTVSGSGIRSIQISDPLLQFNGLESQVSNFEVGADGRIYFSTERYLYDVLLDSREYHYIGPLASCLAAEALVYAGDLVLIAYCNDSSVVYFDLDFQAYINQTSYSESGIPYVCPNADVSLAVYPEASYIQYGVWSEHTSKPFDIPENFDSGVCFGTVNNTLFAFIDKEDGAYILEAESSSLVRYLTPVACLSDQCQPLIIFESRHLVLRGQEENDGTVLVLDSHQNFSTIITAQHTQADLLTVLVMNRNASAPTRTASQPSHSIVVGLAVGVPAVVVVVVIIVLVWKCRRKLRSLLKRPTQFPELFPAIDDFPTDDFPTDDFPTDDFPTEESTKDPGKLHLPSYPGPSSRPSLSPISATGNHSTGINPSETPFGTTPIQASGGSPMSFSHATMQILYETENAMATSDTSTSILNEPSSDQWAETPTECVDHN